MSVEDYPAGFDEQYRAGFEAWAVKNGYDISRDPSGSYTSSYSQMIWLDWAVDEHDNRLPTEDCASDLVAKEARVSDGLSGSRQVGLRRASNELQQRAKPFTDAPIR